MDYPNVYRITFTREIEVEARNEEEALEIAKTETIMSDFDIEVDCVKDNSKEAYEMDLGMTYTD